MKLFGLTSVLSLSAVTLATILLSNKPAFSQQATFVCGTNEGSPATIVKTPQHGDVTIIAWNSGFFGSSGFDNKTRCDIVSQKFQDFYNKGTLKYFAAGKASNKQPIICAVSSTNSPCNDDSQLFTLKPDSDAEKTLQKLFDIRSGATSQALQEVPNPNADERTYVNFEEFLENKANKVDATVQDASSIEESPEVSSDDRIF